MQFGALQGEHAVGELLIDAQLVEHFVGGRDDPALGHFGVGGGEGEDEFVTIDAGLRDGLDVVGKRVVFVEDDVVCVPLAVAVRPPLGEVLLGDRAAIEAPLEGLDDFGFGVEPIHEFVCLFAVVEAKVEFFPDVSREVGDFTVACFHIVFVIWIEFLR